MAISGQLLGFVKEGLQRGLHRSQIQDALLIEFPIPVPRPTSYVSARDAFMYAVLFMSLCVSSYYLADLLFELINRAFSDPAMVQAYGQTPRQALRWAVSSLVVAFPLFLYVAWLNGQNIRRDPTKRASKVRQQVTYLTLFVASCALVGASLRSSTTCSAVN